MLANPQSKRGVSRPILERSSNWEDWKMHVELLFEMAGVQSYINGTVVKGQFDKQKNSRALYILVSSISPDLMNDLRAAGYHKAKPAWHVWALLESMVPKPPAPPSFDLMTEMMSLDRGNFPTLKAFLDRFRYLWDQVAKKETLTDWCWTNIALNAIKKTNPGWHRHWQTELETRGTIKRESLDTFLVEMAYKEAQGHASIAAPTPVPDNSPGGNAGEMSYMPPSVVGPSVVGNVMFNQPIEPVPGECMCPTWRGGPRHRLDECIYLVLDSSDFQLYQNIAS